MTREYQEEIKLREGLLVAFFGGLVVWVGLSDGGLSLSSPVSTHYRSIWAGLH